MTQPLRLLPGGVPLEVVRGEPFAVVASFVDAAGDPLPLTGTFAAELLDRDAVPLSGGAMAVDATGAATGVLRVEASAAASALLVDSLHRWRLRDVSSGHTVLDGLVRPRPSGAAGVAAASFEVTAQVAMGEAVVTVSVMTTGSSGGGGGGADLSDATPAPLGVAAAGVDGEASRADHVHAMPTAGDVGALSASSGYNTAGGWLRLDASGTAPDNTIPASIARDTEVTAAVAAHAGAADPHGDRAYADGLAANYATAAQGATADTAVQPGDLATVATTGVYGDLSGRPTLGTAAAAATGDFDAAGAATAAVAAIPVDGAAGVASLRTLGAGALQAAAGNDSRLSDARTPSAHHASHEDGGSDEVTLAQSQVTGLVADLAGKVPTTRTVAGLDLTADRSAADVRGALGTGTPDGTTYLRGDGQWAAAGGGGGLTLGETNSTAYRGDRGKTAYDHSQSTGNPHSTAIGDISGLQTALDGKAPATRTVGTGLGTTGTVNLDLASLHGTIQTMTLTGNPTFTTSNLAAGREVTLVIAAGGAGRTIAYPAWVAVGAALPTSLASGKTLVVTLLATSTTDASVVAAAAVQP